MPSALLVAVGSRGDTEPLAALAATLSSSPSWTHVLPFFQQDLTHLSPPSLSSSLHALPFSQSDFYRFLANPSGVTERDSPRARFDAVVSDIIAELVLPCADAVLAAAAEACVDVIVCTRLARPLAMALAEKMGVKVCVAYLQPTAPTTLFPHHSEHEKCAEALAKAAAGGDGETKGEEDREKVRQLYWDLEMAQWKFLETRMAAFRKKLGMRAQDFNEIKPALVGDDPNVIIANCFPSELVPSITAECGPSVYDVGPLADAYIPSSFLAADVDARLEQFLAAGPRPVCVGYGSMPLAGAQAAMSARVLSALREARVERVVIVGGAAQMGVRHVEEKGLREWAEGRVLEVQSCPYPWLLPKCRAMLCHGGAGVLSAALRAGTPLVISPFLGDQFTWALVVEKMGLGAAAGPKLPDVSMESLVDGIRVALSDEVQEKCMTVREAIASKPTGASRMQKVLESHLAMQ